MPAYITECPQHSLLVAHDNDRLTRKVRGEKSLRLRDRALYAIHLPASLVQRSYKLPRMPEDIASFNLQNRWINIKARRQCVRALNVFVHIEVQGLVLHKEDFRDNAPLRISARPAATSADRVSAIGRPEYELQVEVVSS
jgi:hypothetical protein